MDQKAEIVQDNHKERQRLINLMGRLREEDFDQALPNGWTVTATFAHMAFWDLRQEFLLKRWVSSGVKPGSIPGSFDYDAINGPMIIIFKEIPPKKVVKLTTEAAQSIDALVEEFTPMQIEELIQAGLERNVRRALHRRAHLDKIEKAI